MVMNPKAASKKSLHKLLEDFPLEFTATQLQQYASLLVATSKKSQMFRLDAGYNNISCDHVCTNHKCSNHVTDSRKVYCTVCESARNS